MLLDGNQARQHLNRFDFARLFVEELGWDHYRQSLRVTIDQRDFALEGVAALCGFAVLVCRPADGGALPAYTERQRIDREVTKQLYEHLIIFVDGDRQRQEWQWVRRESGRPPRPRTFTYRVGDRADLLLQRLAGIQVDLEELAELGLPDVTQRVRASFDLEPVTRAFYRRFETERAAFAEFLSGIPDDGLQRWYVSVMLNRLMFIYFVQQKGFLAGDRDYLTTKLTESRERGPDRYYRELLCPLFFEGFAKQPGDRDPAVAERLGAVPYLNGGLFLRHEIEEHHGAAIQIPDSAFVRLFGFFREYRWHLDERPLRAQNEINPDVLGYIFEKYINQKQMGAYYTKEDITEYIGKNTIIPFLFDAAQRRCGVAFRPGGAVWRLLADDPDRYLYPAVRHGTNLELPEYIAKGLESVPERGRWNEPAPDDYALPTEIWREVVARRQRYEGVKGKLAAGEVSSINDLITFNLDLRTFAEDVIRGCEGPDLLAAFWEAIAKVTVLDPTCGSGAFLFAALNILEPLYEACLDRMAFFLAEWGGASQQEHRSYRQRFEQILARIDQHPSRDYFILKSIVVNNLFGVDLMAEAVEICKLRLFLKLVAQVERVDQIEPLPDIDFNIQAGNTLVGYATYDEVETALQYAGLDFDGAAPRIRSAASKLARDTAWFRQLQTDWAVPPKTMADAKSDVRDKRAALAAELDRRLAAEYGVELHNMMGGGSSPEFEAWRASHQPFHWFVEFHGIMEAGGFDVIVGNPPYVQYSAAQLGYKLEGYATDRCANLFAYTVERSTGLACRSGRFGMIIPMSAVATSKMEPLRRVLLARTSELFVSNYSGDAHPAVLFNGVKMRLSIVIGRIGRPAAGCATVATTKFVRWYAEARKELFDGLVYGPADSGLCWSDLLPKIGSAMEARLIERLFAQHKPMGGYLVTHGSHSVYAHRIVAHFVKCFDAIPYFWNQTDGVKRSEDYKVFSFGQRDHALAAAAVLNSNTFYFFYLQYSDAYHCGRELIEGFPCQLDDLLAASGPDLLRCNEDLMSELRRTSVRRRIEYRTGLIEYDEFYPRLCKPLADEIDRVLAAHYGFTDEELDFIINYDIKYRMGRDSGGEGEDD